MNKKLYHQEENKENMSDSKCMNKRTIEMNKNNNLRDVNKILVWEYIHHIKQQIKQDGTNVLDLTSACFDKTQKCQSSSRNMA